MDAENVFFRHKNQRTQRSPGRKAQAIGVAITRTFYGLCGRLTTPAFPQGRDDTGFLVVSLNHAFASFQQHAKSGTIAVTIAFAGQSPSSLSRNFRISAACRGRTVLIGGSTPLPLTICSHCVERGQPAPHDVRDNSLDTASACVLQSPSHIRSCRQLFPSKFLQEQNVYRASYFGQQGTLRFAFFHLPAFKDGSS